MVAGLNFTVAQRLPTKHTPGGVPQSSKCIYNCIYREFRQSFRTNKTMVEGFEWDEAKSRANRIKHGIGFAEACLIFDGPVLTSVDDRRDYGEERCISYGELGGLVVVVVVHTLRAGKIRLISARKANRKETQEYYEHLEETA